MGRFRRPRPDLFDDEVASLSRVEFELKKGGRQETQKS